jgi:hypothetical protein|tara:strand:- start:437 stop:610 length:174 start_codon:yes stop_codon:yes gene_type:complete
MNFLRTVINVSVWIDVLMKSSTGQSPVNQLNRADFNDSVPVRYLKSSGLSIQYDLTH